jgi:hypothetical protein
MLYCYAKIRHLEYDSRKDKLNKLRIIKRPHVGKNRKPPVIKNHVKSFSPDIPQGVKIPMNDWANWIKSLPVRNSKITPVAPEFESKALAMAQSVDKSNEIMRLDTGLPLSQDELFDRLSK